MLRNFKILFMEELCKKLKLSVEEKNIERDVYEADEAFVAATPFCASSDFFE